MIVRVEGVSACSCYVTPNCSIEAYGEELRAEISKSKASRWKELCDEVDRDIMVARRL